jgi:predicted esterase
MANETLLPPGAKRIAMSNRVAVIAFVTLAWPALARAQVERYDLGRKLRACETAWHDQRDPDARHRAVPVLKAAVPFFLAGRGAEAAETLDRTRFLLRSAAEPSAAERWAAPLVTRPHTRLLDPADGPLIVEIRAFYDVKVSMPDRVSLTCTLLSARPADPLTAPVPSLPHKVIVPIGLLPEGDLTLRVTVAVDGQCVATHDHLISVVPRLRERLQAVKAAAANGTAATTERLTLKSLADLLTTLAGSYTFETDYPAARLLAEAEALAKTSGIERYYGPQRTGQFWLTLATGLGAAPVRLFVPDGLTADKRVPLVVALHGAGGSENLFFDAYGCGAIVGRCKERGWVLVATRAGVLGQVPPVAEVVDALARIYPVDVKHVYLVGHSLGAMHAVDLLQAMPGKIAAAAALGGGGTVRKPEAIKGVPVFVGCGTEDFALGWVRNLAKALAAAGAAVRVKEYADVEHITVVQDALKDVFAFFENSTQ